ncbi:hypothetical protein [Streptomyces avicenniae]|uniref:hypothetical protein n=1 Tax=Streptomyces avicenniae TaxID=500153 RepID=UPI00069BDF33|nr:hypothetical protein [Streptomyces avicenniae]
MARTGRPSVRSGARLPAASDDAAFLAEILLTAFTWDAPGRFTPEAIALGGALLDALVARAVADGNAAVRLYAARGFRTVGRSGDADTMLLRLDGAAPSRD